MKDESQTQRTDTKFRSICILLTLATTACAHAAFIKVENGGLFQVQNAGGASWGDYDADGDIDLFASLGQDGFNSLHRNLGGGEFDRPSVTEIGDLASDTYVAVQGVWADIDNDGDIDLYVANRRTVPGGPLTNDHIYWNDGQGSFTLQEVAGTSDANLLPHGASLVDFDNDGDLDLLEPTYKGSEALPEAFFRNDGNGVFSRLAIQNAPLTRLPNTSAWADFDGDGDLDVVIVNNDWGAAPSYIFILRGS